VELLRGDAPFVADTSPWWRVLALPSELGSMLQQSVRADRLWITPIVRDGDLYSARTCAEHGALEAELDALRIPAQRSRRSEHGLGCPSASSPHGATATRIPPADALIAAAPPRPNTAVSRYSTATRTATASQRSSTSRACHSRDRRQAPAQPRQSGSTNSAAREPANRPQRASRNGRTAAPASWPGAPRRVWPLRDDRIRGKALAGTGGGADLSSCVRSPRDRSLSTPFDRWTTCTG
jgi:hypothetical protein